VILKLGQYVKYLAVSLLEGWKGDRRRRAKGQGSGRVGRCFVEVMAKRLTELYGKRFSSQHLRHMR